MSPKYEPLTRYLDDQPADEAVALTYEELAALVGGLPASAADQKSWWGNTWGHSHGAAWLQAGRKVTAVHLGDHVVFSPADAATGTPPPAKRNGSGGGLPPVANGVDALQAVLERAGYPTVVHAVAAHTLFFRPATVAQTGGEPMKSALFSSL